MANNMEPKNQVADGKSRGKKRCATNFIINNPHRLKPGYKNHKTRLKELNMLPTSYRREIIDVAMLIKSLNNDNGFDRYMMPD